MASVKTLRKILWSPLGDARVVVVAHDVRMYVHEDDNYFRQTALLSDPSIVHCRAVAWSPDSSTPDLIALGMVSGKIHLSRLSDTGYLSATHAYSTASATDLNDDTVGTNADGTQFHSRIPSGSGIVQTFYPTSAPSGEPGVTHQHPVYLAEFYPKQMRPCTAVAFCPQNPALLASGYEKTRNDPGLLIWDIEAQVRSPTATIASASQPYSSYQPVENSGPHSGMFTGGVYPPTHSRHLSASERRGNLVRENSFTRGFVGTPAMADGQHRGGSAAFPIAGEGSRAGGDQKQEKPLYQYGPGEVASSLAWLSHDSHARQIVAGMGLKWIRMFDLRSSAVPALSVATRAVNGLTVDHFNSYRVASYSDDCEIKVWDLRKPTEALLTIPAPAREPQTLQRGAIATAAAADRSAPINHLAFCPSRPGVLGVAYRDVPHMHVFELTEQPVGTTAPSVPAMHPRRTSFNEAAAAAAATAASLAATQPGSDVLLMHDPVPNVTLSIFRKKVCGTNTVASFDFVPAPSSAFPDKTQVVLLTKVPPPPSTAAAPTAPTGELLQLEVATLHDVPQAAWNPSGRIAASLGTTVTFQRLDDAIPAIMFRRAKAGYGLNATVNQKVVAGDSALEQLWRWMERTERLAGTSHVLIHGFDFSYQGIVDALKDAGNGSIPINGLFGDWYSSQQRKLALNMIGLSDENLEIEISQLEREGNYMKAALWAFLYSDLNRAIRALNASQDQRLHLVSAVLSGYSLTPNAAWVERCRHLSEELTQPELRSMFTYMSTFDWSVVLYEKIDLREKLLIVLRYYSDAELQQYVSHTAADMIRDGELQGLAFTGLSTDGVRLLANYVDNKGDVQTAALVMSTVVPGRFTDSMVEMWVEEYRDFLDQQRLFHERAKFDIAVTKLAGPEKMKVTSQIHVRCNFCDQSISQNVIFPVIKDSGGRRVAVSTATLSSMPKNKLAVCPNCAKSLPRCALCLLSMGGQVDVRRPVPALMALSDMMTQPPLSAVNGSPELAVMAANVPSGFDAWFTWCQMCRHGGHSVHVMEWFGKHTRCPVADCDCRCSVL
ncbi:hypothetical protein AMAG_10385 [Allomyces macrogynus ATCC 38327]|uniref:Uncharacterized protein n=1 Tax=Allomyces macrogynus (strain ATCC 38327) TaxID=578462 RepID=A0A0L0SU86_ALLM3|nr:hypothetical protein AMAG_10385 [Allomyces macrogynus ATCC 38327]|eukprot:KNE66133.1 hypothetical protein AMAG_10385 [Allomyces macrogynus ATCC 38327]